VRGVTKHGTSELRLNAHVEGLLVESGRASGVRLAGGRIVRAREAVVCNADLWSTKRMVDASRDLGMTSGDLEEGQNLGRASADLAPEGPEGQNLGRTSADLGRTSGNLAPELARLSAELAERANGVGRCRSFLHLHLGIEGHGLPLEPSEEFPAQWAVVDDWG